MQYINIQSPGITEFHNLSTYLHYLPTYLDIHLSRYRKKQRGSSIHWLPPNFLNARNNRGWAGGQELNQLRSFMWVAETQVLKQFQLPLMVRSSRNLELGMEIGLEPRYSECGKWCLKRPLTQQVKHQYSRTSFTPDYDTC